MGEYAEMMLDGTCCESCGEVFDDILCGAEIPGFPRMCKTCAKIAEQMEQDNDAENR